ncbi:PREDICTED: diacylglycerol kinase 4-like [Nelumbo nucifera]|uniref:Diacylglycerol kinase n=1 Tax=Nelumbo nucifera TaxID=4432 RepID=A0A1U8Q0B1_NELNU|nr:PREDICTED: diacylglycerol kinase 4-like [Nelumbo nucifera]
MARWEERDGEMASPSGNRGESTRIVARSSLVDSLKGCGLSGVRIDKEDLKRRILIPEYLRLAMRNAIQSKDPNAGDRHAGSGNEQAPEAPMVVFVNSRSGGRYGPILKGRLQELMGQEQVFDLSVVKPTEFVQYGLACLEKLADLGDHCARDIRSKLRVVVAGGDGTVGWVLGSLGELYRQNREPVPPIGIIPLGTGNDLSRSFGWGGSFPFAWKSAVKMSLSKAITGSVCRLDSWHVLVSMPAGGNVDLPHSLRHTEECTLDQDLVVEGEMPEKQTCFEGVFYNYFSVDRQISDQILVANECVEDLRRFNRKGFVCKLDLEKAYDFVDWNFLIELALFLSIFIHKIIVYRGLKNILRLHIKKVNCSEWEQIRVPSSVRAIVALNLHNYGSGRNPWGKPKPEYMEKRGFVEAHVDDGLLEVFGLKQGWHASFVMVELITAKHIAQAAAIRLEVRGGEWKHSYMQMDGEPWKQPMSNQFSTFVEIRRVPYQSLMIRGE